MKRELHRNLTLAVCHAVAVLGAALLLASAVTSPAAEVEVQSAPDGRAAAGPLAWWRLDEGTGNVAHDAAGHGFEGVIRGAARWVEGPSGKALSFDGHSLVEVPLPQPKQMEGPITIQALICPADEKPNTFKHILAPVYELAW
jgi:hypothetical protein